MRTVVTGAGTRHTAGPCCGISEGSNGTRLDSVDGSYKCDDQEKRVKFNTIIREERIRIAGQSAEYLTKVILLETILVKIFIRM